MKKLFTLLILLFGVLSSLMAATPTQTATVYASIPCFLEDKIELLVYDSEKVYKKSVKLTEVPNMYMNGDKVYKAEIPFTDTIWIDDNNGMWEWFSVSTTSTKYLSYENRRVADSFDEARYDYEIGTNNLVEFTNYQIYLHEMSLDMPVRHIGNNVYQGGSPVGVRVDDNQYTMTYAYQSNWTESSNCVRIEKVVDAPEQFGYYDVIGTYDANTQSFDVTWNFKNALVDLYFKTYSYSIYDMQMDGVNKHRLELPSISLNKGTYYYYIRDVVNRIKTEEIEISIAEDGIYDLVWTYNASTQEYNVDITKINNSEEEGGEEGGDDNGNDNTGGDNTGGDDEGGEVTPPTSTEFDTTTDQGVTFVVNPNSANPVYVPLTYSYNAEFQTAQYTGTYTVTDLDFTAKIGGLTNLDVINFGTNGQALQPNSVYNPTRGASNGFTITSDYKVGDILNINATLDSDWNVTLIINVTKTLEPSPNDITLYYVNSNEWDTVNGYVWPTGGDGLLKWPGAPATKIDKTVDGNEIYSYSFDATKADNIIFNNGLGGPENQTSDLVVIASKPYYYDGVWYETLTFDGAGGDEGGNEGGDDPIDPDTPDGPTPDPVVAIKNLMIQPFERVLPKTTTSTVATFTLQNANTATVSIEGLDEDFFEIGEQNIGNGECSVSIVFKPIVKGVYYATLVVTTDDEVSLSIDFAAAAGDETFEPGDVPELNPDPVNPGTPDDEVSVEEVSAIMIYAKEGTIYSEVEFEIYDLAGVNVTKLNGSLQGVYIVKTAEGNRLVSVW